MGGGAAPAVQLVGVLLQRCAARNLSVWSELTAQRGQLAFDSLAKVHQRTLQTGAHLFGRCVAHLAARAVLQQAKENQCDRKPQNQGVPARILGREKPYFASHAFTQLRSSSDATEIIGRLAAEVIDHAVVHEGGRYELSASGHGAV